MGAISFVRDLSTNGASVPVKMQELASPPTKPSLVEKDRLRIMPHMDLKHLRSVVFLAEELHFGKAAARLNMTQPPLSQQIQRLEEELDVKLFFRTKRQVRLTESGKIFVREGRRILAQAEQAVRLTINASRGEVGLLGLGYIGSADSIIAEIIKAFARRTPNVQLELHSMSTTAQNQALHTGQIQAGFLRLPISDSKLNTQVFLKEPLIVALPQGHHLAATKRLRLSALSGEPLVAVSRSSDMGLHDSITTACRRAGFNPRFVCETDDTYANLALVSAGLGISLLPASIRNFQRSGVVFRCLQSPVPYTEMAVAYLSENPSHLLQLFLCVLQEVVARKLRPSQARTGARFSH